MIEEFFPLSEKIQKLDKEVLKLCKESFAKVEEIKEYNQLKMLKAFTECKVAASHLVGTTGYGYDDRGREKLEQVFARVTGSEDALFRHNFMSGTHALTVALFGLLRPGDKMVSVTGKPYDTLANVIGLDKNDGNGTLIEFGIKYVQVPFLNDELDYKKIAEECKNAKICYVQRSRGYAERPTLTLENIEKIANVAKNANPNIWVMVDNCYGEFTQKKEPTEVGADLIVGSLIKNPGGGIAPTGGYIAGKAELVEKCAHRLTAPGVGKEIGCTTDMLRQLYLGLYYAPGVTAEAVKTSIYAACLFEKLGYAASPHYTVLRNDIVTSVNMLTPKGLRAACEGVQAGSPVDSFVTPEPWPMPGYSDDIIMAAGAFTMGSSIELSCDGPMREPYTAYMQGGINFTASRAGLLLAVKKLFKDSNI